MRARAAIHGRLAAFACALALAGCVQDPLTVIERAIDGEQVAEVAVIDGYAPPPPDAPPFEPVVVAAAYVGPPVMAFDDGPYLLDTGDRLRVFVYGQPSLSRAYTVDHDGRITVPLIGHLDARGRTTAEIESAIKHRLGSEFVRDPQVTVDILQNRPFFILGEVRNAGQYPYVSGMTVETAIAIAGGYSERASDRSFRVTRRANGVVGQIDVPADFVVQPGDTVFVYERFF